MCGILLKIFQKFIFIDWLNLLKYGSEGVAFLKGGDYILIINNVAPIENISAFSPLYYGYTYILLNFPSISP